MSQTVTVVESVTTKPADIITEVKPAAAAGKLKLSLKETKKDTVAGVATALGDMKLSNNNKKAVEQACTSVHQVFRKTANIALKGMTAEEAKAAQVQSDQRVDRVKLVLLNTVEHSAEATKQRTAAAVEKHISKLTK
jgi:hypothetical protein